MINSLEALASKKWVDLKTNASCLKICDFRLKNLDTLQISLGLYNWYEKY